jgi:hypothetical protein
MFSLTQLGLFVVTLYIACIFCIAVIYLIYQLNAHIQLNIYIYIYYLSNTCYMFQRILHHRTTVTCSKLSAYYNAVKLVTEHVIQRM